MSEDRHDRNSIGVRAIHFAPFRTSGSNPSLSYIMTGELQMVRTRVLVFSDRLKGTRARDPFKSQPGPNISMQGLIISRNELENRGVQTPGC